MRVKWISYPYQEHALKFILDHKGCGVFMDMGLGKTVVELTAVDILMFDRFEISKVLVIAPLKVAQNVWQQEAEKWDHLHRLKVTLVIGSEKERLEALRSNANIFVINPENVAWLIAQYKSGWPFDKVIADECTRFKNPASKRFKAYRMVIPKVQRTSNLTGTPTPNGLLDLWAPTYMLDQGKRLGDSYAKFRDRYFTKNEYTRSYSLRTEAPGSLLGEGIYEKEITSKISDICFSMNKRDYLDMPDVINRDISIRLPAAIMQKYFDFEKRLVLEIDDVDNITAVNAAALNTKLLQFASGAVYDSERNVHEIHNCKLEALEEILEDLNGNPLLLFYAYQHDAARIKQFLHRFKPRQLKGPKDVIAWNSKQERLVIGHPASMSEGLNLQAGGHNILWYSQHYNRGWYDQGIARLDRLGQDFAVVNNRLIARGTKDEEAAAILDAKGNVQAMVMNSFKATIAKYRKIKK